MHSELVSSPASSISRKSHAVAIAHALSAPTISKSGEDLSTWTSLHVISGAFSAGPRPRERPRSSFW
eukprot:9047088-Heterocapsa_arctica.AAC.1